ncbi:MAG TPA: twin-arginine translocation signal domain-containing protein, partial [Opitutaceae bacterium]|nr:twin-arginine translocation signal domain-containing protein [Opitutaceae bacterium]
MKTPFPCAGHRALWSPTRREFLYSLGASVGSVALTAMLAGESRAAVTANPLAPKPVQVPAKAKNCIFLMME